MTSKLRKNDPKAQGVVCSTNAPADPRHPPNRSVLLQCISNKPSINNRRCFTTVDAHGFANLHRHPNTARRNLYIDRDYNRAAISSISCYFKNGGHKFLVGHDERVLELDGAGERWRRGNTLGDRDSQETGAFLIPYLVFVVTCGVPLFLLETAMGQYTQEGGITCWHWHCRVGFCPLAEGAECWLSLEVLRRLGGMYVFQLFDYYACNGACVLFLSVFESLAMGWIFGAEKMFDIVEDMTKSRPNYIFMLCWKYLTPLISLCLEQRDGSLERHLEDYLNLAHLTTFPDDCLCSFLIAGLNTSTRAQLSDDKDRQHEPTSGHVSDSAATFEPAPSGATKLNNTTEPELHVSDQVCKPAATSITEGVLVDIQVMEVSFIYSIVEYQPLTFNHWYVYPDWAYAQGWLLALSSILLVPGWALSQMFVGKGSLKQQQVEIQENTFTAEMEDLVRSNTN
ncbi:Sodium- and chloride-dependent betaine transporter [Anabarilius grahami]|uniref:Sodium-and chloride-dependent betaine transporter n=1 Tax=Anabarilius grahami TaxID=495550 RepID=A0A3N0XQT8_ANAGA|nr:Sodium- and chloride-dependent betaine transporter [Anabarilius grahami]